MRFHTVHDVIDQSRSIHVALSHKYQELEQLVSSERAQWLLEYLNRHENRMAEALRKYDDDLSASIKETWLQQDPHWVSEDILNSLEDIDANDTQALMSAALSVDTAIVDGYRALARTADTDEIRAVLGSILDMEDQEQHRIATGLMRGLDS